MTIHQRQHLPLFFETFTYPFLKRPFQHWNSHSASELTLNTCTKPEGDLTTFTLLIYTYSLHDFFRILHTHARSTTNILDLYHRDTYWETFTAQHTSIHITARYNTTFRVYCQYYLLTQDYLQKILSSTYLLFSTLDNRQDFLPYDQRDYPTSHNIPLYFTLFRLHTNIANTYGIRRENDYYREPAITFLAYPFSTICQSHHSFTTPTDQVMYQFIHTC